MKDYIVAFFVVLALSCFFNGPSMPVSIPVGITGAIDATSGANRPDNQVPEINYADASANAPQLTGMDETSQHQQSPSQNGSNF